MEKLFLWFFALIICQTYGFYFDGQPRILANDGNLIVESAKDRNITFRLQGVGCLNVNDVNIFKIMEGAAVHSSPSGNVIARIKATEESIADLRSRDQSQINRIARLENGSRSGSPFPPVAPIPLRNVQSRLTRLETKVDRLLATLNEDDCRSNPCQNGGTCVDMYNDFDCRCPLNWEGKTCSTDVNECGYFAGTDLGCQNGATCLNSPGSYSCACSSGWQGLHCTKRNVDCASSGNELCGHGSCITTSDATGYKCICDQGWKTNGVSLACIVDVDECSEMRPYCSKDPAVQCMNLPGTFMCGLCPAGFTGNGHYCNDINECETNNGGCSTAPTVQCINTRGSYHCGSCPSGWQGDGRYCVRTAPSNDGPTAACLRQNFCHPLATCVEAATGPVCICPSGYVGTGFGSNGCASGFRLLHPCAINPCHNGGTCIANGTLFRCICPAETNPPLCASEFNPCVPNPCQNGGTCSRTRGLNYRCSCTQSYTGNACETERSECGGVLTGQSGNLKYPLSDSYPHNSRCAWLITTINTQVLNITFTKFAVEASTECRFDWLQIHDGRSSSSHIIGRFCGATLPKGGNIVSTTNMLYFWFRSDNSSAHDGFELNWNSIDPICGGTFDVNSHGTISSPGSPGKYPPNRDCVWDLTAPAGKRIQFQFFTMQLEAHESCQYDYVAIYSGSITSGTLLNKFCNTSHPEPITTPHNHAVVQFHSDQSEGDAGFQIHYTILEGIPGCGGVFTASNGEFGPPIQNGAYQKNMLCDYLIRMPLDSRIQIKFNSFQLEESWDCEFDYIEIFEGTSDKDPKVNRYCGNVTPPDYTSLGNVLLIVFKSDWSASYEGFRISYEISCGGLFENETGTLMSPFYPNQYEHSRTCYYEILAPPAKAVSLHFEDIDIEDTSYPDCDFDFIQIFDGFDVNSTLIGKYCGTTLPPNALSTLNALTLLFQSDTSVSGKGFKATYSLIDLKCGGVIKTLGHDIKPPKQTNSLSYEHDTECLWIIVAPKGFVIQLTFVAFHLEQSIDCSMDYVSIYEGTVINGTKVQSYCGTNLPPVTQSNNNVLSLKFVSDSSITGGGFTASYVFIDSKEVCGGTFYGPTGYIQSPGWPSEYLDNKDCRWVISAPTGQQIQLSVNTFEMERHYNCTFDFLEIRNGGTMESPIIGKYCGIEIPKVIRSYTNQMHIQFKSDSSRNYKGVDIEWDAMSSGCGGNINNLIRGSIVSPNYPNPYGVNSQCDWRITVSKGSVVQLMFSDLELEEHTECIFDYIEIFDGRSTAAKSLGKYCTLNVVPSQILSSSNEIFIRMVSDVNNQGRGFDLKFNTICSLNITSHRGVIESPNFPGQYSNNLQCEWTIKAPLGNKILVAFSQFEIEGFGDEYNDGSQECAIDSLEIIQGKSDDKELIQSEVYCKRMPKDFTSIGDLVTIKFITDESIGASGFHLEFEVQGCGDVFTRPSGNFTTPNYPSLYPHDVTCEWSIITDYGNVIELTINELDIESSCYDNLTISSDGNYSHPLTTLCHRLSKPFTVTSHGNELFLKLITDSTYSGRGFSAYYTTRAIQCGGVFKIRHATFTSPKYPNNYDANLYCEWFLEVEDNHRVSLSFDDFSMEYGGEHDSVKIYNGFDKIDGKLMDTLSGNEIPKTIYNSTENKMLVVMQTDGTIESKGFSAKFKMACGGSIIVNESGSIEMDSFNGMQDLSCNWTLIAPKPEEHITLTIASFQSALSGLHDWHDSFRILIYDGDDTTAPLTKDFSSNYHPPPVVSSGNSLTISVIEEDFNFNLKFNFKFIAFYSTLENTCGGKFSDIRGQIASPSYPNSYPTDVECVWELSASPGNRLTLTFAKFDLELSDNCNEDYLEIRENDISGKLIGVYCGNDVPSNLPQAERFWLKFRSNSDGVAAGFLAQYTYATFVEIDGSSGVITSPLYPQIHPHIAQDYRYRITVRYGFYISIVTKEFLSKTGHVAIAIHDGYDEAAPAEELHEMNSNQILSSSNVVFITSGLHFMQEFIFKLEWNEVSEKRQKIKNETQTTNCTENSVLYVNTMSSININSPGYPYGYSPGLNCIWTLKPEEIGYHAIFSFMEIDLEDNTDCLSDYVQVSSSSDLSNYKVLNRTCQLMALTPNSVLTFHGTPYLKLNFITDRYFNSTGFIGIATARCGSSMTGPSGVITVTNYSNSNCEWSITVRRGRTIKFEFIKFNVHQYAERDCRSYVLLKNGESMESPFLGQGKYCGSTIPNIEKTSSNRALVVFKEDITTSRNSFFTLRYEEVTFECGGTIVFNGENSSIIHTPNYPNIPDPHIECVWNVIVPSGELIQVNFIERFDVTNTKECDEEYVELRDGGTLNGNLIGTFCGQMPATQYSTSNMLRIKYYTDIPVPMNGFKANITLAKCGGFYRSNSGFIQSTNYPGLGAYEKNTICEYRLIGRGGSVMNLTFLDLHLPSADNCDTVDHIEIYNIVQSGNPTYDPATDEIGKYCGNERLPDSILTSSVVLVRFVTQKANSEFRGFRISFSSSAETCGGEITAESGVLASPGYPIGRSFPQICEWRITVPNGRRVKVDILDLDFVDTQTLKQMYAYIKAPQSLIFFDGFMKFVRIKQLSQNQTTEPIYSSDNRMLVTLIIRQSNAGHRGFKLRFSSEEPSICVGDLNGDEGSIELPKNTSIYFCEYQRSPNNPFIRDANNVGTIGIYITETAATSYCSQLAPIHIQYLPLTRNRYLAHKCNVTNEYPPIASPFPEVKVGAMKGGYHVDVSPLTINYKINNCGKLIKDTQEITIRNPSFSVNYGRVACAWQYTTVENAPIAISGNYRNLDCATEFIKIYLAPLPPGVGKEKLCGQSSTQIANYTIPRSASSIFIEYHSSSYNPNSTFEINIKADYSVCGGTVEHPIFEFSSPSNGSQYPNNIECIWDISTNIGYHIGLTFINRFFIEDSVNCTNDYIEILDYVDNEWKLISRVCGRSTPKPFNSTGIQMRIIFRTNGNVVGDGFTVKWEENCGGIFLVTKDQQILTSLKYPNNYPGNLKCNYTLIAAEGDYINVDFDDFELEDSTRSCIYDNLTIYRYSPWHRRPIKVGVYCWKRSLTHIRYQHRINLIFSSDEYIAKRGFSSKFYSDTCGGNVTNSSMIEVPQEEPGKYAEYLTCVWSIKAPDNKKIVIRFEYFDLETHFRCDKDAVAVYQGLNTDPVNRKALLCGNLTQHTPIINIDSNNAVVHFHSSWIRKNHRGFSALVLFGEKCDKTIELTDKTTSYKLDKIETSYPPHLDCQYVVTVPEGFVVKMEFEQFHLAPCHNDNSSCTCDFVAVYDGSEIFSEPIQKNLCGHNLPQSVTSTGRSLFIRYVTDSTVSNSGFSADIKMEPIECGINLIRLNSTTPEHTLTWPINSSTYRPNSKCDWTIEVPDSEQVQIHFEKFELEDGDSENKCTRDVLTLTDEDSNLYNSEGLSAQFVFSGGKQRVLRPSFFLGRSFPTDPHDYCGSGIPNDFISRSKRVRIRFRSNDELQYSGFRLIARMSPACHRNYTSLQGRIYSKKLSDCETYITVQDNYTISLYFGSVHASTVYSPFQCTVETASIKIFDYRSNRLIQHICAGEFVNPVFINTSSLMIKFINMENSRWSMNVDYDITYLATDKGVGCGGQIYNNAGQFSSPWYPANDRNVSDCRWDISVPQNLVVYLIFSVFDMGHAVHCADNYVQIIETDFDGKETIVRKYCGDDVPSGYKSIRNILSIRFKKTSNFAGSGWYVHFIAAHPLALT